MDIAQHEWNTMENSEVHINAMVTDIIEGTYILEKYRNKNDGGHEKVQVFCYIPVNNFNFGIVEICNLLQVIAMKM